MHEKRKRQKVRSIFGEQLERLARERHLTHRQLAEWAGVSTSVIGSWLGVGGAIPADLMRVKQLADQLQVDFAWLLIGEHSQSGNISLAELFDEVLDPSLSGLFRIECKRLIPKGLKK